MDHLKELSLSKLQKGDFDKFKFLVNKLLESHGFIKKNILDATKHLLWTRAFERLLWFGPVFLISLEKKIHLSMN